MKKKIEYYDKMYYDRIMSDDIIKSLSSEYLWLIDFVKARKEKDLDFQTGSNKGISWVSIYRGTSRIFRIVDNRKISIDAAPKYLELEPKLYSEPSPQLIESLIEKMKKFVCEDGKFVGKNTLGRYFDNYREGYHQNNISRRYGICGKQDDNIIIVDKESVIGFESDAIRRDRLREFSNPYRDKARKIMNAKEGRFPSKMDEMNWGNECDFIALTKFGELILMELKDYQDTQKIYLSPFQISMYCDIFNHYDKESNEEFRKVILEMIKQKQKLGLLNPLWPVPKEITKISAALIVGFKDENKQLSKTAITNYKIVRNHINKYEIATYATKGDSGEIEMMLL